MERLFAVRAAGIFTPAPNPQSGSAASGYNAPPWTWAA
jgi:hypothetical protein